MKSHKNSLVKVLEYLVNEEREKASDLLHTIFVEKAKNHWSALSENDEYTEDDIQDDDDDLDEAYTFEEIDDSDDEEDFLDDIESADDEIDGEEFYDDDGMNDAGEELAFDMDVDDEDMDDEDMNTDGGDVSDALSNVKDAIEELRSAFADIEGIDMSDEDESDDDLGDFDDDEEEPDFGDYEDDEEIDDEMDSYEDDEDEDEDEVEPFKESAELRKVNVKSKNGEDSGAKSPVKDAGNDMATPHETDTSEEKSKKANAPKKMNVRGPQGAAKLSAAPTPKRPDTKSTSPSPLRGRK